MSRGQTMSRRTRSRPTPAASRDLPRSPAKLCPPAGEVQCLERSPAFQSDTGDPSSVAATQAESDDYCEPEPNYEPGPDDKPKDEVEVEPAASRDLPRSPAKLCPPAGEVQCLERSSAFQSDTGTRAAWRPHRQSRTTTASRSRTMSRDRRTRSALHPGVTPKSETGNLSTLARKGVAGGEETGKATSPLSVFQRVQGQGRGADEGLWQCHRLGRGTGSSQAHAVLVATARGGSGGG
jgi:hypothetical protein